MMRLPHKPQGLGDDLRVAIALLTRLPVFHPDGPMPAYLVRAFRVFPIVGAGIGAAVGSMHLGLLWLHLPVTTAAALALGASAALTGALHEDGLADVGDGFIGGHDRTTALAIMRDSCHRTSGVMVLIVSFAARLFALAALPATAVLPALVAAYALGRAAIPALSAFLPAARADGLGLRAGAAPPTIALTAGAVALVIVVVVLPIWEALFATALAIAATVGVGALAKRKIGGQTGDVFGAADQAIEVAVLVLCAARLG
jgi:adenosylcobinamide-GDP ribazoletransferase